MSAITRSCLGRATDRNAEPARKEHQLSKRLPRAREKLNAGIRRIRIPSDRWLLSPAYDPLPVRTVTWCPRRTSSAATSPSNWPVGAASGQKNWFISNMRIGCMLLLKFCNTSNDYPQSSISGFGTTVPVRRSIDNCQNADTMKTSPQNLLSSLYGSERAVACLLLPATLPCRF